MSHRLRSLAASPLALLLLGAAACTDTDSPSSPMETPAGQPVAAFGHQQPTVSAVNADLAAARRATAHLQRFENAAAGGWDFQATDCKENPPLGGMGYHFGNFDFYLDGEVNPAEPEILLYEPQASGRLRLVAVEYAVPYFTWAGDPEVDDPPQVFGRDMKRVDEMGEFQLHVWLWKHNPSGLFEDWNPNVTCEHA